VKAAPQRAQASVRDAGMAESGEGFVMAGRRLAPFVAAIKR